MTTRSAPAWSIRRLHAVNDAQVEGLADVLIDCVEGGASVSFMLPLTRDRAVMFWRRVAQGVASGDRVLLVTEDSQGLCGTVQLIFDLPENQPHRADLAKMLVHRRARRQGLGAALMQAAEEAARQRGKSLLVLDAVTNGDAARLYERMGWIRVGDVPNFALMPRGEPCSTTYYYRNLANPGSAVGLEANTTMTAVTNDHGCAPMPTRTLAILVFDDVEVLDFCGPFEVFSVANRFTDRPAFNVLTVAERAGPVLTRGGLSVNPHRRLADCPPPNVLLVPGGQGTRTEMHNPTLVEWIKQVSTKAELVLSVCTGSLLLAKAGLLDDLEATTHHGATDLLRQTAPKTTVHADRRFVDNGRVVCSAGIAAGIDMSLHVVSRLLGQKVAARTARQMEYPWEVDARYAR